VINITLLKVGYFLILWFGSHFRLR